MRGRFNGRVIGMDHNGRNTRHNGRAGIYNAVQSAFAPSLDITLANGLWSLFTYTRATTATVKDFEGLIKSCLSGELRIQGARRVRNAIAGSSENFTNGSWGDVHGGTGVAATATAGFADPNGGTGAYRIQLDNGGGGTVGDYSIWRNVTSLSNSSYTMASVWIKSNTASSQVLSLNYGGSNITVTTSWQRLSTLNSALLSGRFDISTKGGVGQNQVVDVLVYRAQLEDVTGQSNQNPSEYVSVGVLSSPYHGYFADGVKYFSYQNGNTVASNVVTEAQGAAITGTIGYLPEGAITQLFTQTEDLSHADWSKTSLTISANTAVSPDGATTMDTCTPSAASAFLSQTKTISSGAVHIISGYFKKKDADDYCCLTGSDTVANGVRAWFNLNTGTVGSVTGFGAGWSGSNAAIEEYGTGTGIYRCSFVITPTGTTLAAGAHPSVSGDNTVISTVGRANYAWGLNINAGSVLSSYVPATTASVARNADVDSAPSAGILNSTAMTIAMRWAPEAASMGTVFLFGTYVDANNYTAILHDGTNIIARKRIGGANHDSTKALTYAANTSYRITARFDSTNGCDIWVDGVKGTNDNTTTAAQVGTTFQIGADGNSLQQAFGVIPTFKAYRSNLSDGQAAAL